MLKARSPSLSLDRGKKRSKFDADLRTVDRVDSVETGCSKVEMYDGALSLRERWTSKHILYCILASMGSQCNSLSTVLLLQLQLQCYHTHCCSGSGSG